MKKHLKNILILSILLLLISYLVLVSFGKTYTIKYRIHKDREYTLKVENNTGEVEIIKEERKDDMHIVKIKAKKPGKVFIKLDNKEYSEMTLIYVHKNMIITDNTILGKSTASEVIPISILILLLYIFYLLLRLYKKTINDNLYQYKNIAYLGILIFLSFFIIINLTTIYNYQGLYETINKTLGSVTAIATLLLPLSLITWILVTISNLNLIRKEGKSLKNLLGLFLGLLICVLTIAPNRIYGLLLGYGKIDIFNLNSPGPYIYNFLETLAYLTSTYLECILIATIIIAIKSVKRKIKHNKDYMIILGCMINKDGTLTPLLKGRVDKAIEFRNQQIKDTGKDLVFIPSGGQGENEIMSEAQAIKNYLLEQKINKKNIIIEDKSTNTYENIRNSVKLIKNKGNIAFSTTNYHVLRAGIIATEQCLKLEGIGSKTKLYFWINAFIREFIGTLYSERKKHIISLSIIILSIIIMISLTYIVNNI